MKNGPSPPWIFHAGPDYTLHVEEMQILVEILNSLSWWLKLGYWFCVLGKPGEGFQADTIAAKLSKTKGTLVSLGYLW
jgi:hypothetical protein